MKALLVTYADMMLSLIDIGKLQRSDSSIQATIYIGIDRMCQVWKVDP